MATSVILQCTPDESKCQQILSILNNLKIKCSKIIHVPLGFKATIEAGIDSLFDTSTLVKLQDYCTPIEPLKLVSDRTIIIKSIAKIVLNNPEDKIIDDINQRYENIKVKSLTKFPNGKTCKIVLENVGMARALLDTGITICNLFIPAKYLEIEEYRDVLYCFRCYKINSHVAANCDKNQNYKICSTCASEGHTYKECHSNRIKCINCAESHITISSKCLQAKINKEVPRQQYPTLAKTSQAASTYASVTSKPQNVPSQQTFPSQQIVPSRNDALRCYMSILIASSVENNTLETFQNNLNSLLAANNLPSFHSAGLIIPNSILPNHPKVNTNSPEKATDKSINDIKRPPYLKTEEADKMKKTNKAEPENDLDLDPNSTISADKNVKPSTLSNKKNQKNKCNCPKIFYTS